MSQTQRLLTAPCGCLISATVAGDEDGRDSRELRLTVVVDAHQLCDQHAKVARRSEHAIVITEDS